MVADVLEDLRSAAGGQAGEASEADAVDGMPARWVARPGSADETSAVLKAAAVHGLTVVPRGSASKLVWGAPPERVDLVLDTTGMDQVVEHAAGDLIVVVGAGRTLEALQEDLAHAGQRLGVDPARSGTVGGAVATATTGPTRLFHGAVRDLVIGVRLVRADGVIARAGGKVVKNVAGYDLGKLLTGSFGTLGVITEVAFRLHPVPQAASWVTAEFPPSTEALYRRVQALVHAQVAPSAIELDRAPDGSTTLSVLLEGIPPGVEARTAEVLELLGETAGASSGPPSWWGAEPESTRGILVKVTHEIGRLRELHDAVDAACAVSGVASAMRGSPAVGTALVGVAGDVQAQSVARFVDQLRDRAGSFGGTAVLLQAPRAIKDGYDVWGPVGALDLMRSVKQQFDPERRLSPGRFVGGI